MSDPSAPGRILVVGSANMDLVVSSPRFPGPGETLLADAFAMYPGGKGANQAVACARLGGRVALLARMGADVFRDHLTASLHADGIDTAHVLVDDEAPTGVALITVDARGENTILVASGSNMRLTPSDVDAHRDAFRGAAAVLLQLEIPLETVGRAAELARAHGASVILNPAPARELPDDLLRRVDVLTPNESEAALLTGLPVTDSASAEEAARRLLERGVGHVLVTLGARGVLLVDRDGVRSFPARRVEAVDTTAAGDAFNGALAWALARGEPLDAAVRQATTVAAYAVTKPGAQPSMPTRDDLTRFEDALAG